MILTDNVKLFINTYIINTLHPKAAKSQRLSIGLYEYFELDVAVDYTTITTKGAKYVQKRFGK